MRNHPNTPQGVRGGNPKLITQQPQKQQWNQRRAPPYRQYQSASQCADHQAQTHQRRYPPRHGPEGDPRRNRAGNGQ
nr:MAG TPA: hypothetical protein [Caudoviricetes sp.]